MYQHGANLDFLFSDSEINSGTVGDAIAINGKGQVIGVTYARPMLTESSYTHQWSVGFQNKTFENQVSIFGSPNQ